MEKKTSKEKLNERALDALKRYKPGMDTLAKERAKVNKYYYGKPFGNEVEGLSEVVSRDVYETVEGMMPSLMRVFYGGQNVVEVTAQGGADDEDKAKLMEEKINFDFQKQNKGFKILYQFFKDALLHRCGWVNWSWDKTPKWKYHSYDNITESYIKDLELGLFGNPHIIDEKVVVTEKGVDTNGMITEAVYNVVCREKIKQSKPLFINIPLEDIIFNMDMKDVEDLEGVIIYRVRIHKRKLKEYGFDEEKISDTVSKYDSNAELISRFSDLGGISFLTDDVKSEFVFIHFCYLYDFDEEGNPIPKIVPIVGEEVGTIQVNKYGRPPFAVITPNIIAHRLVGLSSADSVMDIQDQSSAFLRMILDSGYLSNNGVTVWNPFNIENIPERLLPGTQIIMKEEGDPRMVMSNIPPTQLPAHIVNIYSQILPKIKARRTGLTDFSAGLDPKALATRTSGGISQLMSSSLQVQELITRCFAETGVRDMFVADMQMNIDFFDIEQNVKINKKWETITRDKINGLFDITIDVGVGTGSKDMIFNHLINMLNTYGGIANAAKDPNIIAMVFTPENIRNILISAWEMIGFKNAKGRFTANDTTEQTGLIQGSGEGQEIPGVTEAASIPGINRGGGQGYPQEMAAMSY